MREVRMKKKRRENKYRISVLNKSNFLANWLNQLSHYVHI